MTANMPPSLIAKPASKVELKRMNAPRKMADHENEVSPLSATDWFHK